MIVTSSRKQAPILFTPKKDDGRSKSKKSACYINNTPVKVTLVINPNIISYNQRKKQRTGGTATHRNSQKYSARQTSI